MRARVTSSWPSIGRDNEVVHAQIEGAQHAGAASISARQNIGICRVRSKERIWLHRRNASKSFKPRLDDEEVISAGDALDQRSCGSFSTSTTALPRMAEKNLIGRGIAVVDKQNAAVAAILRKRLNERVGHAETDGSRGTGAQFIEHHFEPRQRPHPGDQRDFIDRLGQEIVGARLQPLEPVGRLVEGGHHDDRDMGGQRIALEPAAGLEAVHAGHHHIKKHDIAVMARADRQGFGTARRGHDIEIFRREARFQQFQIWNDVVNDQDFERSYPTLPQRYALLERMRAISLGT